MKSFVALAILLASAVTAQHAPLGIRAHRRGFSPEVLERMNELLDKRDPLPQIPGVGISFPGSGDPTDSTSESTSQSTTSRSADPPGNTSSSTPVNPPPPEQSTSSTSTISTPSTTSTSQTSTSSTSSATTSASASASNAPQASVISRTSLGTYQGISFASSRTSITRSTATATDVSEPTEDTGSSFSQNKVAVAATATVAALVALGALIFIAFWWKKKSKRGQMAEDMWDEASMKEFSRPAGTPIVAPPPPVMRNVDLDSEMGDPVGAGLGRSNTKVLPSQAALARSRSTHQHEHVYEEEPDTILAMPPVAHYERPRDSAYDIVPAAPPAAAYGQASNNAAYGYGNAYASGSGSAGGAGSSSGGLQPPVRKGDHTSFGSGIGNDPFAGTGFVDASRESTYGPGQAGRGAGYAAQSQGHEQQQWAPTYNPYTGYSQQGGPAQGYGGGYGYAN